MTEEVVNRRRAARRAQKVNDAAAETLRAATKTGDSFQNFALNLGIGTDNALTGSTYGYNPITLIRTLLEWIHRGSWLGGIAVDVPADDMTRAGIEYKTTMPPDDIETMLAAATRLDLWGSMNDGEKWARLYGGSLVVMLIDGQDPKTELRLNTIKKSQLKGFLVLDRWMVEPSMENLVTDYGPSMGLPKYYRVTADAPGLPRQTIHYSRVMRLEGIRLPYWQRLSNNLWGLSVIERLYDRMIAFDSATQGAAQLVYKSFLRTLKLKGLREAVVAGGDALLGVSAQVNNMRRYQGIEGVTLIDAEDELNVDDHGSFSGIGEALGQFGQQISGALQMPLTRMFGQSPTGFNSGDSDLRMYYDGVKLKQEREFRNSLTTFLTVMAKSEGVTLPKDFWFDFRSLWELDDVQKADVAGKVTTCVSAAFGDGLISQRTALKELRQSSRVTGVFSNITDEDIEAAEEEPPDPNEALLGAAGEGQEGAPELDAGEETAKVLPSEGSAVARDAARIRDFQGLLLYIETAKGEVRRGRDANGHIWEVNMPADYGFIAGVPSAEGPFEELDCFVGPSEGSDQVFVINQKHLSSGAFDEHKVMLGFKAVDEALAIYGAAFSDGLGLQRILSIKPMTMVRFKAWLKKADVLKPCVG